LIDGLGAVALIKISDSDGKLKGSGFANAGIVCSFLFAAIGGAFRSAKYDVGEASELFLDIIRKKTNFISFT